MFNTIEREKDSLLMVVSWTRHRLIQLVSKIETKVTTTMAAYHSLWTTYRDQGSTSASPTWRSRRRRFSGRTLSSSSCCSSTKVEEFTFSFFFYFFQQKKKRNAECAVMWCNSFWVLKNVSLFLFILDIFILIFSCFGKPSHILFFPFFFKMCCGEMDLLKFHFKNYKLC